MQYKYIPTPNTIFSNTFKLNQGCYAEISLNDMYFKKYEYWNIQNEIFQYKKVKINEDKIYFKNRLKKHSKVQLKINYWEMLILDLFCLEVLIHL